MRSSAKENQSLEVKVKGISEMEFSLSVFDYTFTNYVSSWAFSSGGIFSMALSPVFISIFSQPNNEQLYLFLSGMQQVERAVNLINN